MALEGVQHDEGLDGEPPPGQDCARFRFKRHWSTEARKFYAVDELACDVRMDVSNVDGAVGHRVTLCGLENEACR